MKRNSTWVLVFAMQIASALVPALRAEDGVLTSEDSSSSSGIGLSRAGGSDREARLDKLIFREGLSDADPALSRRYMGYVADQFDAGVPDAVGVHRNGKPRFYAMDRVLSDTERDINALPPGDPAGRTQLRTTMRFFDRDLNATDHGRLGKLWYSRGYGNPAYNHLGRLSRKDTAIPRVYKDYQGRLAEIELENGYDSVPANAEYRRFIGDLQSFDSLARYDNAAGEGRLGRFAHAVGSPRQWWNYGGGATPEARSALDRSFYDYAERAYPGYSRPQRMPVYTRPSRGRDASPSFWDRLSPHAWGRMAGAGVF